MRQDPIVQRYWDDLLIRFADDQLVLCNRADHVLATGSTIPILWDGTCDGRSAGWDAALDHGMRQPRRRRSERASLP
jgi:hypothetical protein